MTTLIKLTMMSYAFTFVLASGAIFNVPRNYLMAKTPWLRPLTHKHFLECRMCLGFWVSLGVCWYFHRLGLVWAVYGLSYFLATQER